MSCADRAAPSLTFDCAVGLPPCLTPSDDHGFWIDEAEVTYWGLCPGCSPARTSWAPRSA